MSDSIFLKILMRKNSLKKNIAELDVESLEKVISNLNEFVVEKREEEEAEAALAAEKQSKIDAIRQQMAEAGIDADELLSMIPETKKQKVAAKYRLEDDEGQVHEWSGRGRTPLAFQSAFDKGSSKEDFLIAEA
ncbi:H-NS family nucleoid-associated regulatory protein (plasmid) [Neptuniibacter sp. QD72_48]|uniref:H-NS histone family protein n=1 Tax=Neptuniibacter sp. QD72_48 TaxID=3398214 RepID=UPI0039F53C95